MLSSLSSTIMTVFAIPDLPAAQRRWQLGHDGKRLVAIPYGNANAGRHAPWQIRPQTPRSTRGMRYSGAPIRCDRSPTVGGTTKPALPSLGGQHRLAVGGTLVASHEACFGE